MTDKILEMVMGECFSSLGRGSNGKDGYVCHPMVRTQYSLALNAGYYSPEEHFRTVDSFLKRANKFCKPGIYVVVRPKWNQHKDGWDEWRSFDGEPLRKVSFRFGKLPEVEPTNTDDHEDKGGWA